MFEVPNFRSVMRGYDPTEVDMKVEDLVGSANQMQAEIERLREQIADQQGHIVELETEQAQGNDPALSDIGERAQRMFAMLEDEVRQIRANAVTEAQRLHNDSRQDADLTRQEADAYSADIRTQAEQDATRVMTDAQASANDIVTAADQAAQARGAEAQAAYDQQRARIAAMISEFEQSLVERREQSEAEFTARMKEQESAISAAEQQRAVIETDSEHYRHTKQAEADGILQDAQSEARKIVKQAEIAAEQTRREADRDLQATEARKDAIAAQMLALRQMLSGTLPGTVDGPPALPGPPAEITMASTPQSASSARPKPTPPPRQPGAPTQSRPNDDHVRDSHVRDSHVVVQPDADDMVQTGSSQRIDEANLLDAIMSIGDDTKTRKPR